MQRDVGNIITAPGIQLAVNAITFSTKVTFDLCWVLAVVTSNYSSHHISPPKGV